MKRNKEISINCSVFVVVDNLLCMPQCINDAGRKWQIACKCEFVYKAVVNHTRMQVYHILTE